MNPAEMPAVLRSPRSAPHALVLRRMQAEAAASYRACLERAERAPAEWAEIERAEALEHLARAQALADVLRHLEPDAPAVALPDGRAA